MPLDITRRGRYQVENFSQHNTVEEAIQNATNKSIELQRPVNITPPSYEIDAVGLMEIFEGIPTSEPAAPSGILASETWETSPSSTILNQGGTWDGVSGVDPYGPFLGINFSTNSSGSSQGVTGSYFPLTHYSGAAPDGTGMLRGTVPSDWNNANESCYISTVFTHEGVFGTHRFRNFSYRTLFRHSGTPYFFDTGEGKAWYIQIDVTPDFTFTESDLSGHITLTCSNDWTFNSGDGTYTGTFTLSSGSIPVNTLLFPLTGTAALDIGVCLQVLAVNGSNITVTSHTRTRNINQGIPGYDFPPVTGDTFAALMVCAETLDIGGNSADLLFPEANGLDGWRIQVANTAVNFSGAYTITTSLGATISATAGGTKRFEMNGYRDALAVLSGTSGGYFNGGSSDANAQQLSIPGWFYSMFGHSTLFCNNPWNLAQNTNYFYFYDHSDEIYCIELEVNAEVSPWVIKVYLTTPWGAANLSSGTAGTHTSDASAFGGNVMHYHDYLYFHYEMPLPALTLSSGDRSGFRCENGSYAGNSVNTSAQGAYFEHGRHDVASSHIGVADIY